MLIQRADIVSLGSCRLGRMLFCQLEFLVWFTAFQLDCAGGSPSSRAPVGGFVSFSEIEMESGRVTLIYGSSKVKGKAWQGFSQI